MQAIRRPFHSFTTDDDLTWKLLFEKQWPQVQQFACQRWLDGVATLGLTADGVPNFAAMSAQLQALVDWQLVSTDVVYSDGQDWFEHLTRRAFLITEYIRERGDLDYTPLPDIWHDTFGHLPFIVECRYADLLQKFGAVAIQYSAEERKSLGSLWWYTIEFGFIMEGDTLKAFGAGLMSSPAEMLRAYSNDVERVPFDIAEFEHIDPSPHVMHDRLFILESFEQLEDALDEWVKFQK